MLLTATTQDNLPSQQGLIWPGRPSAKGDIPWIPVLHMHSPYATQATRKWGSCEFLSL